MRALKVASFTVRATVEQSARWKRAAEAEGFASVGSWAAGALDAHLRHQARAGRPMPLSWRRGRSTVRMESGELVTVKGHVSPPFFAYRGDSGRADPYSHHFSLVHQPDGRLIATLRSYAQCRTLASEIAPALLRGELPDPAGIAERHQRESV